jgi:hypothetical protein
MHGPWVKEWVPITCTQKPMLNGIARYFRQMRRSSNHNLLPDATPQLLDV